jgi:hypothetical protein
MTNEKIINIFHSISFGVGNHGSFLKNLANTVVSADKNNFDMLKPFLEEIIEKYDLNKKPYVE